MSSNTTTTTGVSISSDPTVDHFFFGFFVVLALTILFCRCCSGKVIKRIGLVQMLAGVVLLIVANTILTGAAMMISGLFWTMAGYEMMMDQGHKEQFQSHQSHAILEDGFDNSDGRVVELVVDPETNRILANQESGQGNGITAEEADSDREQFATRGKTSFLKLFFQW